MVSARRVGQKTPAADPTHGIILTEDHIEIAFDAARGAKQKVWFDAPIDDLYDIALEALYVAWRSFKPGPMDFERYITYVVYKRVRWARGNKYNQNRPPTVYLSESVLSDSADITYADILSTMTTTEELALANIYVEEELAKGRQFEPEVEVRPPNNQKKRLCSWCCNRYPPDDLDAHRAFCPRRPVAID